MNFNEFCCYSNSNLSEVIYSYVSKINGSKTLIDHFLVSSNLSEKLMKYTVVDTVHNISDHVAISCKLNFDISNDIIPKNKANPNRPAWDIATNIDIEIYKELIDKYLLEIPLPSSLINCQDFNCKNHHNDICSFHNAIDDALVKACEESIPVKRPKCNNSKTITGWNEHVEHLFRTALFWHKLWVENDRPTNGIIANIHRTTRNLYHKTRKDVIKNEVLIYQINQQTA